MQLYALSSKYATTNCSVQSRISQIEYLADNQSLWAKEKNMRMLKNPSPNHYRILSHQSDYCTTVRIWFLYCRRIIII